MSAAPALLAEALRRFGEVRVKAAGTSMVPAIRPADVLVIQHVSMDQLSAGDVVMYTREDRLFAHRVLNIGEGFACVTTRGDAHRQSDSPITESAVLGRVVAVERDGRAVPPTSWSSGRHRPWALALGEMLRIISRVRTMCAGRRDPEPRPASPAG